MPRVLVTTVPFGDRDRTPFDLLAAAGIDYVINPLGRKLREEELAELVPGFDALVAGTELISERVFARGMNLKLVSRVGIGLDSVDLLAAERRGVKVSYTPDAPAPAVAELTIGLMMALLRGIHVANAQMHRGEWSRIFGRRIAESTIGVIGAGRIGQRVVGQVLALGARRVLVNDVVQRGDLFRESSRVEWASKNDIYRAADVITVHVPLTASTRNLIQERHLRAMKPDAMVINTSRGGIVNERDLARVLVDGHLAGAAVDVFEKEPYQGELRTIERCLLTCHMGSMSVDCRTRMEIEATAEVCRHFTGAPLLGEVPEAEYDNQRQDLMEGRNG